MFKLLLLPTLACLVNCSLLVDAAEVTPFGGPDGGEQGKEKETPDSGVALVCNDWPAAAQIFELCDEATNSNELVIHGGLWQIDTDLGVLQDANGDSVEVASTNKVLASGVEARVLLVESLSLQSSLRAYGSRALVIASATTIDITGQLYAMSDGDREAAGAGGPNCDLGNGAQGDDKLFGGNGAGGGAHASSGGEGGEGSSNDPNSLIGGLPLPDTDLGFQGGCRGGHGGNSERGGGKGGGALALVAKGKISIAGIVSSNGLGGEGGAYNQLAGGGGGGAGGMLLVASAQLSLSPTAVLLANGGAGGGGAGYLKGGDAGEQGSRGTTAASGGDGRSGAGDGGAGSSHAVAEGLAGRSGAVSGGGGGGGAGVIMLKAPLQVADGAVISPRQNP